MIGSIASFSAMAIAGREVSSDFDTFEIMMYRSAIGIIIVSGLITLNGAWAQVRTQQAGNHVIRNVAHFTGQNLWFYAVTVIPLAQVFALEFTSPLWVVVLSPLILGERLTRVRALAALLGFVGILIVARPDASTLNAGIGAAAACAVFFAVTIMFTKRLTRTETISCILFYLTAIQLVLGLIAAGHDGDIALPTAQTLPYLVLIGCAGLLAHYCLTNALAIAPATVVIPMDFVRLPVIAVLGMVLYQEGLDIWVFVGALIIFAGNYMNIWVESRVARAR
ncbi:EamA family transporter [Sulfitobacter sp. JL08]|uniref:DMT family transporter n=1 Tax=Sulfitobacter sp. JL08 TaxID=2070369 RepID=UPI000E0A964F|nr:DMT family transporter [Sulfitobacter sp. JL08]AXI56916.1 EamA family transporter [Sulfitobacter sp. JL08]